VFDLTGKVIIVTGGGGGLGKPIAIAMAGCGADVIVTSRDESHLAPVVEAIEAQGNKGLAVACDVTSPESVQAMVDTVMADYGKIDVVVNVAGTNARFSAEEIAPDEFERVVRFNVLGMFNVCQAVGKVMIAQGYGKIVNMSSVRGRVAPDMGGSAYATSKGAVDQMTRTLAAEWAKYGITCNAVAPALIMTDMTREFLSKPEVYSKVTAQIPLKRLGVPEEVIGPFILLAAKESDFMTGQIIYVDGGLSAV